MVDMTPDVLGDEPGPPPASATNLSTPVLVALLCAGAAIAGAGAILTTGVMSTILWLVAIITLAAAAVAGPWRDAVSGGRVRIDADGRALRFVPSTALLTATAAVAFAILALGVTIAIVTATVGNPDGFPVPGFLGAGIALTGLQVWQLSIPVGLTVSEQGLSGVRGVKRLDIPWQDLATVTVIEARTAWLKLVTQDGRTYAIGGQWIGSDPRVVAPIVEHFGANPGDRHLLGEPRAAIARVESSRRGA